jgi:xanthine/uracil/vitamin C permease (AzgA family)
VGVPVMVPVDAGLGAVYLGGLLLLMVAAWWSQASDGIAIPRERWPLVARAAALGGWGFFIAGIGLQLVGYLVHVGAARWLQPLGAMH